MSDRQECRNYTLGRRYPMVLGRIRDIVLPWPITMPQLAAALAGLGAMLLTRPVWRALLGPGAITGLIVVSMSVLAPMWVARPTRIEGRSLPAAVGGRLRLLVAPGRGVVADRPVGRLGRLPRRCTATRMSIVTAPAEPIADATVIDAAPTTPVWSCLQ